MPRLSVLMSAYQASQTVAAAMRSALVAMPADAELVVAIDGPGQERTQAAVESVRDRRVVVRPSEVNLGVGGQAVRLFDSTDSRYVARLDADDLAWPWRFRYSLHRLRHVDYVFGTAVRFGRGRLPRPSNPVSLGPTDLAWCLLFCTPLYHSSLTARRDAISRAGGYRNLRYGEDTDLWLRAASLGQRLEKAAIPLIGYRLSSTQLSSGRDVDARFHRSVEYRTGYEALASHLGVPVTSTPSGAPRPDLSEHELRLRLARLRPTARWYLHRQARQSLGI